MEFQPMKPEESGRYVCVAHGGCLHSPHITISSGGVWVRAKDSVNPGGFYTSAHLDCYRAWQQREEGKPVDLELFARTAPAFNCVDFPGEGMHYLSGKACAWCGKSREDIRKELDGPIHDSPQG